MQALDAHAESLGFVATTAIVEIGVAEGASSVMTCHAALRAGRVEVLGDGGRGDLPRLRETGAQVVAIVAAETLACAVCGVAETGAKGACVRRSAEVARGERMTDAARSDVAPVALRVRRVTGVALCVRVEPGGNGHRRAATRGGRVAGSAAARGTRCARVVLRVVELRVEAAKRGETFDGRIARLHVRVADGAHRDVGREKLRQVAIGAGFVAGQIGARRVVACVTGGAGERGVARTVVEKLREINAAHRLLLRFKWRRRV